MTRCNNCKVLVDSQHTHCPLCGIKIAEPAPGICPCCQQKIEPKPVSDTQYPAYNKKNKRKKSAFAAKVLYFLSIVTCTLCIFINYFTFKQEPFLWSAIVAASIGFVWIETRTLPSKRLKLGTKLMIQFFSISFLLFYIDTTSGYTRWSVNYVIPFGAIFLIFLIIIISVSKRGRYRDYMGYLLSSFFISLLPLFCFLFSLSDVIWPSVAAIIFSFLTITGLFLFSGKTFREELAKRFHF